MKSKLNQSTSDRKRDLLLRLSATRASSPYLERVIELGDANNKTLGLCTKKTFLEHAKKKLIIVALNSQSQLLGYLMYAIRRKDRSIRLIHLCIDKQYRGQKVARKLVEHLKQKTKECLGISLHCRRDYGIDPMWRSLGFICLGEKAAKSKNKFLTRWRFDYGQPDLFSSRDRQLTESSLCAILDQREIWLWKICEESADS